MNEKTTRLVTAESVRAGHPDKFCDQVADAILDAHLRQDPNARVAVEVFATAGKIVVGGEITSQAEVDCSRIVAGVINRIGYTMSDLCGDPHGLLELEVCLHEQSPDISAAVGKSMLDAGEALGAGDQGIMVGYAASETAEYMPLPVVLAHRICKRLDELKPTTPWLGADGKAQITVAYENGVPVAVTAVVVSLQHDAEIDHKSIRRFIGKEVLGKVLPRELLKEDTSILINPSGKFVLGGPAADAGLTGRKLAVDQYGPVAHIGGGALSGKDPTKADRSGAYAARWVAKNIVAAGMAKRCEVQIAYAIGKSEPVSVTVDRVGGLLEVIVMPVLMGLDLETYSSAPLPKCGVYRYCDAPDFEILLFSYAFDDAPIETIDLASGEELPKEVISALEDPGIIKVAYNAQFERVCLSRYLGHWLDPHQWRCTMVMAAYLTLPGKLADAAVALGTTEKKMEEGKDLIRYFSVPCKPSKTNGGRTRNLPADAPEKWAVYRQYNAQDVETERAIRKALEKYPLPEQEWELYALNQQINDRGVRVDKKLVKNAIAVDAVFAQAACQRAKELTGLENPGSVNQLKAWLADQDMPMESLARKIVQEKAAQTNGIVAELLNLRLELSKTSVKKYEAMARCVCRDGRVHGLLQFYGANRTGRWAGRLVQAQNLPQNHLPDLELARDIVKIGDEELLDTLYASVPGTLSELIRTAFIPKDGCRFLVADFSAIEARVLAWLANEEWVLEEFRGKGKIYEATASRMFHIPQETIVKGNPNYEYRQKGKQATLSCIAEGQLVLTDHGLIRIRSVAESRPLRDQPFRIYRVVPELSRVTVYARHIFYDLLDNMVREYRPSPAASGAAVVKGLSERCLSPHGFRFYSDLSGTAQDVSFQNINPVEALLGEDGVTGKYRGELARDWYDVYLVQRVGRDTDIQIREGKNLLGISYDVDETGVTTRILPTGEDRDGGVLYLPELYVDSPYLSSYPHPKWMHLPVSEAGESDDEDHPKTKEQCFIELREAAQAQYDAGCDLPDVTLKVDFLNLRNTEEYKQFGLLSEIYLGDSVRVVVPRLAVEVSMRMTQYTYDCLLQKYTAMTLGTAADTLEGVSISSRQLAPGSITGSKLALNTIGAGQLINGSVGSLKIRNAAIGSAHIQTAAITEAHIARALIETLNTNALTAVTARIRELAASSVTTDQMYASVAAIAAAQITAANIVSAHVNWAEIDSLSATIARISRAQLTTANIASADIEWASIQTLSAAVAAIAGASIRTADIDWARIKDLTTDTAIITQGTAGELYIAKLAVTEANLVSLTVGELVVKGADGRFYAVSVDAEGNVTSTLKQIGNDDVQDASIDGGEKIVEGSITAKKLNVQNIFGDTAVIRSLIAANLDVDALFAREATVTALNAVDIRGNRFLRLLVDGKADQESVDGLTERMSRAELKLTDGAIVSAVTGSETYRQDRQKLREDLEALIRDRENWHIADQPPEAPAADTLWLDTSVTPHLLKRWDGAEWVSCGAETDLSQYYTKTEMDTRLEQTDSGIAALSNRITTTAGDAAALAARLEQAELKITPEAITSAVRETGLYQYGAYEGRNYLRSSGDTLTFTNGNLVENGEETSRRYVTLPFSQDLFEHSGNASSLYLSFDIRRTGVTLGGNNSVRAYAGFWFRYTAADAEGNVSNGDRGWYRRVTDAGFVSTDEDWVRIKLGPLDLSGFNAASLRDFQIGINAACEVTGTVQIRHILVEANSQTGIWSPAPEELDSMAERLALAESFIRQNASSIALKVSQAEFDQRMEEAALTISPEQIISAVRSSTGLYHYEPYAGRNYALDSEKTRTFVDGLLLNEDGTASANRFAILKFSPDLFANSTGSAGLRLSFDIKYSDVVPADGKVFSCWFYYTKLSDAGDPVTSGVGWHLSGSGTVTTDWQRVRLGPVKMENYGATGLSYLALGLNASFPVTGMTQIRRVMVEYGEAFTDWDMAPEDPDALVLRLRRAESSITQNAGEIASKVSQNGIISAINQSAEAVSILASKINFNGLVTANQYFKINTDGSMTCTNGTFSGVLSGATGTFSGALSAATGTFAGMLSAATGTFSGTLSAGNWTFNSDGSVYSNGNYAVYMNVSGGVANFYTRNLAAVYGSTSYNDTTIYGGAVTLNCASTGQSVSARNGYWGSYSYTDVCLVCDQSGGSYASARGNLGTRDNRWDILWVDTVHYNSRASDSSREIKHDIHPLTAMGDKLDRLLPVSFIYNDDRRNWKRYGLIYEDTLPVMPDICHEIREGDGISKGISYEDLIAVLVKEVQELRARVAALETKRKK